MIWLLFSALTALVIAAVIGPVVLAKSADSSAAPEVEVYKLQLAELDREEERGMIEKEEAQISRAEISRRLLRASRQNGFALKVTKGAMSNVAFAPMAASIAIGAFGLYFFLGEPSLADQPLESRQSASSFAENASPHGQAGEAPAGHEDGVQGMVDRLAERLKENKGSLDSWAMLIRSYYVLQENDKAQEAVARARQQFASDAKALEAIDSLVRDLTSRNTEAAEGAPASQPDNKGEQQVTADSQDGEPGPEIRGMVSRLAERLKDNKGDLEGWLRLIRSYAVLKETDKAQEAAATARQQFAADPKALEQIDSLLREVKVTAPKS